MVRGPIVSSTSLADVRALLSAADGSDCAPADCWASTVVPAEPSLLLALPLNVPCNHRLGVDAKITQTAHGTEPGEMTITSHTRPERCDVDIAGKVPAGTLALVQVELSRLPAAEYVIKLEQNGPSPRELGVMADYKATVIDLRRPAIVAPDPAIRGIEARGAMTEALADTQAKLKQVDPEATGKVVLLGTTRWGEANLDCLGASPIPRPGLSYPGYVVMVVQSGHLFEYHWSRGRSVFCGGKELPGHKMTGPGGTNGGKDNMGGMDDGM